VTGSPRHAIFKTRVIDLRPKMADGLQILCLPTTYPQDKSLYNLQDETFLWLLEAIEILKRDLQIKICLVVKVKRGYNDQIDHYQKLFAYSHAKILTGDESLEKLIANTQCVITTGSTAALEAALCGKAVIQIIHPSIPRFFKQISGLPLARSKSEILNFLKQLEIGNDSSWRERYVPAFEELADINPEWDSIAKTTEWLSVILKH